MGGTYKTPADSRLSYGADACHPYRPGLQFELESSRRLGGGEAFGVRRLDAALPALPFRYTCWKTSCALIESDESGVEPPHSKGFAGFGRAQYCRSALIRISLSTGQKMRSDCGHG